MKFDRQEFIKNLRNLETKLYYDFKNKDHLITALTHSSFAKEIGKNVVFNERLEFLGDAVVGVCIADMIYNEFTDLPEGEMTKVRAAIVCEQSLAKKAAELNIGDFLLLGKSEITTEGRNRASILADAMEAIIAAIYLDNGYQEATRFVLHHFLADVKKHSQGFVSSDFKTILQEKLQANGKVDINYKIVNEEGPQHKRYFTVSLFVSGVEYGQGSGFSKKEAEQMAAKNALTKVNNK
jgi:ribonuclease III